MAIFLEDLEVNIANLVAVAELSSNASSYEQEAIINTLFFEKVHELKREFDELLEHMAKRADKKHESLPAWEAKKAA